MPAHTPGPWYVDQYDELRDSIPITTGGPSQHAVWVAEVWPQGEEQGRVTPEAEANARLIAAAPDLLALVHRLEAWGVKDAAQGLEGETDYEGLEAIQSEARALLATLEP